MCPRSLTAVFSIAAEAPRGKNENWIPRCARTVGVPNGVDVIHTVGRLTALTISTLAHPRSCVIGLLSQIRQGFANHGGGLVDTARLRRPILLIRRTMSTLVRRAH